MKSSAASIFFEEVKPAHRRNGTRSASLVPFLGYVDRVGLKLSYHACTRSRSPAEWSLFF